MTPVCKHCGIPFRSRKVPPALRAWDANRGCYNFQIPNCDCEKKLLLYGGFRLRNGLIRKLHALALRVLNLLKQIGKSSDFDGHRLV